MLLEEFPQETLVGEVQFFGNLLDSLRGIPHLYPQFQDDVLVDPFVRRTTADAFHGLRQVFGRDAQLLGIPADASFLSKVLFNQLDEPRKDNLCTRMGLVVLLHPIDDVAQIVEHGQQQGLDQVFSEVITLIADLLLDDLEILLEGINFSLFQLHDGMLPREEEQGTDIADILDNLTEEMH